MATHNIYPHPNPDGSNADSRIELQWQRGGDVRIASTKWRGEGAPDTAQVYLPGSHTGTAASGLPLAWDGQFIPLDRDQVNHLIRQLRAARDQAFGRDE